MSRNCLFAHVVVFSALLIGCQSKSAPDEYRGRTESREMVALPRPDAADLRSVGAEKATFFFRYVQEGGDRGTTNQVLVVTTQEKPDLDKVPRLGSTPDENLPNWREIYIVDEETANKINQLLIDRGFYDWKSAMIPPFGSVEDGYSWDVIAKSDSARNKVATNDSWVFNRGLGNPSLEVCPNDSETIALEKRAYGVVNDVREMARANGRLVK